MRKLGLLIVILGILFLGSKIVRIINGTASSPMGGVIMGGFLIFGGYRLIHYTRPIKPTSRRENFARVVGWTTLFFGVCGFGMAIDHLFKGHSDDLTFNFIFSSLLSFVGFKLIHYSVVTRESVDRKKAEYPANDEPLQVPAADPASGPVLPLPPTLLSPPAPPPLTSSETGISPARTAQNDLLNLNSATEEKIAELPGVGPILAKKAITFQKTQGGFKSIEHFAVVLGLRPHHLEKIKSLAIVAAIDEPDDTGPTARMVDY
jgi:hypothetical protein